MKLGSYTFEWMPDKWTLPKAGRLMDVVKTFTSVVAYSWGVTILGKKITLEWDWMSKTMFEELRKLEESDAELVWDPEQIAFVWHGVVTNGPFGVGVVVEGSLSGTRATVSEVDGDENTLKLTDQDGSFIVGETITEIGIPPLASASIVNVEQAPPYKVQILFLDGELADVTAFEAQRREKVKLVLSIMAEN